MSLMVSACVLLELLQNVINGKCVCVARAHVLCACAMLQVTCVLERNKMARTEEAQCRSSNT